METIEEVDGQGEQERGENDKDGEDKHYAGDHPHEGEAEDEGEELGDNDDAQSEDEAAIGGVLSFIQRNPSCIDW